MAGKTKLTPGRIVKHAMAIADRKGLAGLSMRSLAGRLKVEAMSLYHHFAGKDALLDAIVDRIFEKISFETDASCWQTSMTNRALAIREVLRQHPWALGLLDSRRNPGFATLQHHDQVIRLLREAGFSWQLTAHAYSLMDSYIYGFILQEQSLPDSPEENIQELAAEMMEHFPKDRLPHLAEFTSKYVLQPGYEYAREFDFGWQLLLTGLARELP